MFKTSLQGLINICIRSGQTCSKQSTPENHHVSDKEFEQMIKKNTTKSEI